MADLKPGKPIRLPLDWTDESDRAEYEGDYQEIKFNYRHPYPLDANLWFYPGEHDDEAPEWYLDLAWMDGGFEPGKEIRFQREITSATMTEDEAKEWADPFIREVLRNE